MSPSLPDGGKVFKGSGLKADQDYMDDGAPGKDLTTTGLHQFTGHDY